MRARAFGAVVAAVLALCAPARGQPAADPAAIAAAQSMYDAATKEMDAHDYASACPKLEEVVRLVPAGVGARLTLGKCYEAQGKLASAYTSFEVAASLAALAKQPEREQDARDHAERLRPLLATLTIDVAAQVRQLAGLEVKRDGVVAGAAQWGIALPADRGTHTVVVTAPHRETWQRTVEIDKDGAALSVMVEELSLARSAERLPERLPELLPERAPEATTARSEPGPSVAAPPMVQRKSSDLEPASSWGAQRIAGVAVGAVGLGALAAGGALGAVALAKQKQSNDGPCDANDTCDAAGLALRDDSIRAGNASTALFVVAAVATGTGLALFFTAPRAPASTPAVSYGFGPGALLARGTW